jgi:hypothetical protein
VSGNRVGDPLGYEDGLAGFDGVEAVNRLLGGDVLARHLELVVLVALPVGRVNRVGRPRDGEHRPTVGVEIREDVAPAPGRV